MDPMASSERELRGLSHESQSSRALSTVVDITIPVFNEEVGLARSVELLHAYLADTFPFTWRITIVDNASTDGTWDTARRLADEFEHVEAIHLDQKGRGLALRTAWTASDADVVAYMDVDLSTGLDALLPLVAPLVSGHSDLSIGSRLAPGAHVARGPKREFISRCYNVILRTVFATKVRDAQCGFKAVRSDIARKLLPEVEDNGWFFDTELLLLADHNGLRVHEVPVDWVDDLDSRVKVIGTATGDLLGSFRMALKFLRGGGDIDLAGAERYEPDDDFGRRLVTFGLIGAISTAVSLLLFLLLQPTLGVFASNLIALSATVAANSWANARLTARRRHVQWVRAFFVYIAALILSTASLVATSILDASQFFTVVALLASWMVASIFRLAVVDGDYRKFGR